MVCLSKSKPQSETSSPTPDVHTMVEEHTCSLKTSRRKAFHASGMRFLIQKFDIRRHEANGIVERDQKWSSGFRALLGGLYLLQQ